MPFTIFFSVLVNRIPSNGFISFNLLNDIDQIRFDSNLVYVISLE